MLRSEAEGALQNLGLFPGNPSIVFVFRAMSARLINKIRIYAAFLFQDQDGQNVGTTKTAHISDRWRHHIREGEVIEVNWEGSPVMGKIIKLHGKSVSR